MTSVVIPCRMPLACCPLRSSSASAWEWTSMNPGVTAIPTASMTRVAVASDRSPIWSILLPLIPTSATTPGAPVPSNTVPLMISKSKCIALLLRCVSNRRVLCDAFRFIDYPTWARIRARFQPRLSGWIDVMERSRPIHLRRGQNRRVFLTYRSGSSLRQSCRRCSWHLSSRL